jgi:hypothetical protein
MTLAGEHLGGARQDLSEMRTLGLPGGPAVLVIRPPNCRGELRCDDSLMLNRRPPACSQAARRAGSIRPGQRLADELSGVVVLCTLAGDGRLTFDGRELVQTAPTGPDSDRATTRLYPRNTEATAVRRI